MVLRCQLASPAIHTPCERLLLHAGYTECEAHTRERNMDASRSGAYDEFMAAPNTTIMASILPGVRVRPMASAVSFRYRRTF